MNPEIRSMIILDTNVISEAIREDPSPKVQEWMTAQIEPLVTTAITVQELYYGVSILPDGKKKNGLMDAIKEGLHSTQAILPYDAEAARATATILAKFKKSGINIKSPDDAQIAGIALAHKLPVATRNVKDFEAAGVQVINPWDFSETMYLTQSPANAERLLKSIRNREKRNRNLDG